MFSNLNKQFLVFMFFLLLSGIFWLTMTLNETYEHDISVSVRVVGIPKNVVLTSAKTDTVQITVRDKGWMIMTYLYAEQNRPVNIAFKTYDKNHGHGVVPASDLKRILEQSLEASTKIIAVKPEKYEFYYNNGQRKRVPVLWTGRVIPDQLYFISKVTYSPDSIDIYSSKEKLDSIIAVYTEPLNIVNFRDSVSIVCKISHPTDVKVVPEQVQVRFQTDVLTEETMSNIPIQCINLPDGMVLRTFPAKAKVHFVAGASQIRSLQPEDFIVVADYQEIAQNPQEKCTLYLRHVPPGVSRAVLSVQQVDYLIEKE